MSLLDDIRYIAVRINCSSPQGGNKQGSGTIIKDGERYYVMTAAHCLTGKDKKKYEKDNIQINIVIDKNTLIALDVCDVAEYVPDEDKDWALIEVKKPKTDFQYERIKRCYNAADNYMEEFFFYGFTSLEPVGALYKVENRSQAGAYWHLHDIAIDGQADTAHELIDGNSGAGVFFQHGDVFYVVGYVKALINQNGAYSDFRMNSIPQSDTLLTEESVQNITLDVLKDWIRQLPKEERELAKSKLEEDKPTFLSNLERKMAVICSDEEDRTRLIESHIDSYIHGNESMLELLNKGNALYEELNNEDSDLLREIRDNRKISYSTEESAEQDLTSVRDRYSKYALAKFKYDNEQKALANKYTAYRVAEKLMDCSIDYKKKQ